MTDLRRIEETVVPGKRLGRHVDHEARALAQPYAGPRAAVQSVTWPRAIPILDQGDVGSCTGNAMTGALGTGPVYAGLPASHPALDEAEALAIYSAAEVIDGNGPYPPNDYGSSGPSAARAAENAGLIGGSAHYTDLDSTLQALMAGPVCIGINWYTSFDSPSPDGTVAIAPGATVRGGHEVLVRIVDASAEMIGLDNSWGTSYGVGGSFKMSFSTLAQLLSEEGDATAPSPLAPAPAPVPVPVPVPKPGWWAEFTRWLEEFFS